MINREVLERACRVVEQLQEWIEDRDGLSIVPQASLECSVGGLGTLRVWIGNVIVWDSDDSGIDELTFVSCRDVWLEELSAYSPFMESGDDQ